MANRRIVVPEKFYIGFQGRDRFEGETFPLIWIPWEKKDDSAA
jgi:hypothetical protein